MEVYSFEITNRGWARSYNVEINDMKIETATLYNHEMTRQNNVHVIGTHMPLAKQRQFYFFQTYEMETRGVDRPISIDFFHNC